jgi:hypothetical protein
MDAGFAAQERGRTPTLIAEPGLPRETCRGKSLKEIHSLTSEENGKC